MRPTARPSPDRARRSSIARLAASSKSARAIPRHAMPAGAGSRIMRWPGSAGCCQTRSCHSGMTSTEFRSPLTRSGNSGRAELSVIRPGGATKVCEMIRGLAKSIVNSFTADIDLTGRSLVFETATLVGEGRMAGRAGDIEINREETVIRVDAEGKW